MQKDREGTMSLRVIKPLQVQPPLYQSPLDGRVSATKAYVRKPLLFRGGCEVLGSCLSSFGVASGDSPVQWVNKETRMRINHGHQGICSEPRRVYGEVSSHTVSSHYSQPWFPLHSYDVNSENITL